MPYEIPQNLKYKEKIIFNLELKQIFWIAAFGFISLTVYLKGPFTEEFNLIASAFFLLLAFGFAFFDIFSHFKAIANYATSIHKAGYLSKDIKKFLEIEKIDNDVIFLNNSRLRAVIEVEPINFSILSIEQQEAIIGNYMEFLNSLDFGIQIVMRTVPLAMDKYMENLSQKVKGSERSRSFKELNSFKKFVNTAIRKYDVKDRLFYVIVPYETNETLTENIKSVFFNLLGKNSVSDNIANAISQLHIRVKMCQEKLKRCSLKTKRLTTDELTSMLAMFFQNSYSNGTIEISPQLNESSEKWLNISGKHTGIFPQEAAK